MPPPTPPRRLTRGDFRANITPDEYQYLLWVRPAKALLLGLALGLPLWCGLGWVLLHTP